MRAVAKTPPALVALTLVLVLSAWAGAQTLSGVRGQPEMTGGGAAALDESGRVEAAVAELFARDAARVNAARAAETRQNVVRQELEVCVDPQAGTLSGESHLWFESDRRGARLMLDELFDVTSVTDAAGVELDWSRSGEELTVGPLPVSGPPLLELVISYGGSIRHSAQSWVSDDLVVLGPGFWWYPASRGRDPSLLRAEVRYPSGYSSVASGALSGMTPSLLDGGSCRDGDLWEVPTSVQGACIVVGRIESSLTVVGDVFIGHHRQMTDREAGALPAAPASVPPELVELFRFLQACYGPYPFDWLNVVWVPTEAARAPSVIAGPGIVVVRGSRGGPGADVPLAAVASGLSESWWGFWTDPGELVSRSLATRSELAWLGAVGDEDAATRLRGQRRARLMMALRDVDDGASLVGCLDGGADDRICEGKGAAVFEMLEVLLGQDAFCSALRSISETHGGDPVGIGDIAAAMETAAGRDLDWFFYEWMVRDDLPSYTLEYAASPVGGGAFVVKGTISQQGEFFRTPVPLTIDLGGWSYQETVDIESSNQRFELRTDAKPMRIAVDDHQLIPKIDRREHAAIHYDRGRGASAMGSWGKAVDELGAAAALEPDNTVYLEAYAEALVRNGQPAEGLEVLESAIETSPGNVGCRLEAVRLYLGVDGFAGALRHLQPCIASRPDDPALYVHKAEALTGLGRLEEADTAIARARELLFADATRAELDEELYIASGRLYEARGDTVAAVRAYEAALAANPVSDVARRRLRALNLPGSEER